jgi:hypothetical protein
VLLGTPLVTYQSIRFSGPTNAEEIQRDSGLRKFFNKLIYDQEGNINGWYKDSLVSRLNKNR